MEYQCDVYVYESDEGFMTHVAAKRRVHPAPKFPDFVEAEMTEIDAYRKAFKKWYQDPTAEWVDVDPLFAGKAFTDGCAGACAHRLRELAEQGLNVPQYAIESLDEEERTRWQETR